VATGTGLDAQLGFAAESTWGTPVTVTKFAEFQSESLKFEPTFLEPTGLRPGIKHKRVDRVIVSRKTVNGDIVLQHATKNMGLLWKHALASALTAPVQIAATTAYKQIHTPGDFRGLGLTVQVGTPEPSSGTVRPRTYAGIKFSGWEFAISDGDIPTLTLTCEGKSESTATALATAAYTAGNSVFAFPQAVLKLGGTATTASGETTIAGGVAATTTITEMSISGDNPMATERFGLGNAGLKSEPLENDTPTVTGSLSAEFNKAELYDVFQANTTTALELTFTSTVDAGVGNPYLLSFIMPACKFKSGAPSVSGPDIVTVSVDYEAYSDGTNPTLQVKLVSTDTTL
jgi:hypothetical protein